MNITAKTKICLVIGDPIKYSLSPQMHNAGYKALGIDDQFIFVASHVNISEMEDFIKGARAMKIRGVSLTMPHKLEVLKYLDEIDPVAKKIGAVNTIINEANILKGYNTDWLGVVKPLEMITNLTGKHVALIGAGGAARAAVYGFVKKGAKVTIFNRTIKKAKELAEEFGCSYASLDELEKVKVLDIIFNATSVGLHSEENQTPLPKKYITNKHIVFDAIYSSFETRLLQEAKEKGAKTIHGLKMFLYQGTEQFKLYTGHEAPSDIMKKVLIGNIKTI